MPVSVISASLVSDITYIDLWPATIRMSGREAGSQSRVSGKRPASLASKNLKNTNPIAAPCATGSVQDH